MQVVLLLILGLCLSPLQAQTPPPKPADPQAGVPLSLVYPIQPQAAVPVNDEPHHAHELQNDYVHVYNVTVSPLDATLLHQHDLPYIYLMLGQVDIVNAVQGQAEARMRLEDGATRYSPGGFAHLVRTDAGIPFHNITIELVHPQGSPRNLGAQAADRPLGSCPARSSDSRNPQIPAEQVVRCFETDEVELDQVQVEGGKDYEEAAPKTAALLVAMSNADLEVFLGREDAGFLHAGDVLWLPAGTARRITDFLGIRSNFLLLSFKHSALSAK
ncbi:MAG TPA: hypothetical protein VE077_22740 [Candidatus Methylomirabilis sp.]|nr:hypothetical protein [Candidatus Methylomirabilis sp.]